MNRSIGLAGIVALYGAATLAFAQTATGPGQGYPNKPIRIVVPFAAGGPIDIMTRPLAQRLNEAMGTAVLVDNRAGANGIIGMENVAKSPADGYSLVVSSGGTHSIGPNVYTKLPYDIFRDFAPVSLFVTMPELLVVHPALPVRSVKELVALARARPNQLNFGSSGNGGTPHLAGELLKSAAKIEMVHVPVQGHGTGHHGPDCRAEIARAMAHPAMKSFAQGQGAEPVSSTPEELGLMHRREFDKWGGIVRAAGIKAE